MTDQDRFRRWAEDVERHGSRPSELIPAATVIVVRDGPAGIETLMLRRDSRLAFAGGMWVFPGGRIDEGDRRHDRGDELSSARRAAVREAHEEAGLRIDDAELVVFSHWEPPPIVPKRYSTWFFLAAAPDGGSKDVTVDGGEITDHAWLRPADALERRDRLEIELSPPTWVTLHELAAHGSIAEATRTAAARRPETFATRVTTVDGGVVALWHGDAGYETGDAGVPGPRHRLHMLESGWCYERTGRTGRR